MQDDRADAGLAAQPLGGADDRLEHRQVERVVLVGAGQRDDRDVVGDLDVDPISPSAAATVGSAARRRSLIGSAT